MGKGKNHLRLRQNLAILCLSLSALFLLLKVVSYEVGLSGAIVPLFSQAVTPAAPESAPSTDLSGMDGPMNIMVIGSYGQRGFLLPDSGSSELEPLRSLLREALGSARSPATVSAEAFQQALDQGGVFYDNLTTQSGALLSARFGASFDPGFSVRYLLISASRSTVDLYLWDGADAICRCSTALSPSALTEVTSSYDPNDALFAYEAGDAFAHLHPYTLLLFQPISVPAVQGTSALVQLSSDELLASLDFNPHSESNYTLVNGTEVIMESPRRLVIQPDGTLIYSGDTEVTGSLYRIPAADGEATEIEAVLAVRQLAETILSSDVSANGELWLSSVSGSGGTYTVSLDYMVQGVPVLFSDGGSALTAEITDSVITGFQFRCRQYVASADEAVQLLPVRQAAAAALAYEDAFLTACYVDSGGASLTPSWIAQ